MASTLKKFSRNKTLNRHFQAPSSQISPTADLNGHLLCSTFDLRRRRERGIRRQQMRILYGISLPLSRHFHHFNHCRFDRFHCQTSLAVSHAFPQSSQFNFREKVLGFNSRAFSRVSNVDPQTGDEKAQVLNSRVSNLDPQRGAEKLLVLNSRVSNVDPQTGDEKVLVLNSKVSNVDAVREDWKMPLLNSRDFSRVSSVNSRTEGEKLLVFNSRVSNADTKRDNGKMPVFNSRAFSRVSNLDSQTEGEKVPVSNSRVSNVDAEREDEKMPVLNWDGDTEKDDEIDVEGSDGGGNGKGFELGFKDKMVVSNSTVFPRVSNVDVGTDNEVDEAGGSNDEGLDSVDPKEVDRVCKVIEDLFASDRNMEAVLDQCGVNLSHSLVLAVLARFHHARRPAFRFFCWAGQRPGFFHDSQAYNSMMRILGKTRQFETMVEMLEEMGKKGLLTIETFSIAIRAFAAAREMKKSVGIFDLMKRHGFEASVNEFNHLLDALAREKLGKEAKVLFDKMKNRFPPDLRTYSILLAGWCNVKNLVEACKVWNEIMDMGFKPDIVAHNTLLDGLLKGKRKSESIKLFEIMKAKGPSPNVRSYTILIRDLCKGNYMEEAVRYFDEMLELGCQPDAAVYTCLIVGFGNVKKMDKVYGLLKEMREKGCAPDGRTYNALIKLMTNRDMPDDAVRVYKKMIKDGLKPNIYTYNMMMKSYFHAKNYEMGCAVWDEMGKKGCCPDDNSYIVFIGGLIRQGRSDEACKYIEEMISKGMKAPQLDYNKLVADSSRAGKPDVLEELARKTKFSGKFEDSNVFARWGERMKKRVKRRNPDQTGRRLF